MGLFKAPRVEGGLAHSRGFGRLMGVVALVLATALLWQAAPPSAIAQEDGDAAADGAEEGGDAGDADGDASGKRSESVLGWALGSLGYFYSIVFLSLSFTLVALVVMNILQSSRSSVVPTELVEGFDEHLNAKQYTAAHDLAKNDDSFLGKVLAAGLTKLSGEGGAYSQAIEAMQEVGEEENMKLEHRLSYMALIGTISPMIGLLGTVQGMMAAFYEIAKPDTGTPDAAELAAKISTALVTTFVGLAIAIPAIAAYNILRNRVARLVLEVGIASEGLMSRFQNVGKKQA